MSAAHKNKDLNDFFIKNTPAIRKNAIFGLFLVGLLVAGFSFGAIIGFIDDANKPQTTTYTREAKAYNEPAQYTNTIQPSTNPQQRTYNSSQTPDSYTIQVSPSGPAE